MRWVKFVTAWRAAEEAAKQAVVSREHISREKRPPKEHRRPVDASVDRFFAYVLGVLLAAMLFGALYR